MQIFTSYQFHKNQTRCKKLGIYETNTPLPSFSAVWYYNKNIELAERTILNKRIVGLREKGSIRKIISNWAQDSVIPNRCLIRHSIGIITLSVPLVMIVGPFILYVLIGIVVSAIHTACFISERTTILRQ